MSKTVNHWRKPIRQQGAVLVVAIIALIAMTLASIALVRSVDVSNLIAGNLAFQRSATHSADAAIETAIQWLEDCNAGVNGCALGTLNSDDPTNGYASNGNARDASGNLIHAPALGQEWDQYWNVTLANRPPRVLGQDASGNTASFVVDRMCAGAGSANSGASCSASPVITSTSGNAEEGGGPPELNASSAVYYRITVRVDGPRNTVSYVQAVAAI